MKDQEFTDLLNLYLDHEISAADATRLEAEVQGNAARRRVYQQYCRMQKACKVLGTNFQAVTAGGSAETTVVAFDPTAATETGTRRRRAVATWSLGSLAAAAACVAIIFAGRSQPTARDAIAVTSVPAVNAAVAAAVPPRAGGIVQRPMLVADPLLLSGKGHADAELAAAVHQADDQLKWITAVRLAPLQLGVPAEGLRFDVVPATLRPDARTLRKTPAAAEASVDMAAFRFEK